MADLRFFPDLPFAWAFFLVLLGFLAVASYCDYRFLIIPKKLTMSCLGLGVFFNLLRGGFLGGLRLRVWQLPPGEEPSVALGTFDGLLFSLAGFAVAFGLFMLMFAVRACRGGDVKLFAALGTWVGPWYTLYLLVGATVFLILIGFAWLLISSVLYGPTQSGKMYSLTQARKGMREGAKPKSRLMSYSFPTALATLLIMGWVWGLELNIRPPTEPNNRQSLTRNQPDSGKLR